MVYIIGLIVALLALVGLLVLPTVIVSVRFRMQFIRTHGRPPTTAEVDAFFSKGIPQQ